VPVSEIQHLLSSDHTDSATVLRRRMVELDRQVHHLRAQQRLLARLMARQTSMTLGGIRTKPEWVSMLRAAGFTEQDMDEWHCEFEADAPEAHRKFLGALGMPASEIGRVTRWSRSRPVGTA
jgi:hypothetical protein